MVVSLHFPYTRHSRFSAIRTFAGVLLIGQLVLTGCDQSGSGAVADDDGAIETGRTLAVEIYETIAQSREISEPIMGTGTVEALQTTDLGPLVEGVIDEIYVRVGSVVDEGAPLFRTRPDALDLRRRELGHQLELARIESRQAKIGYERTRALHNKGVAPQGRLDDARALQEMALSRLGITEAQLARVDQMLDDTIVRAPWNGVITNRAVDVGRFMTPMSMGARGGISGVVQIMQIDKVRIVVNVPEVELHRIARGTPVSLKIDGYAKQIEGKVTVVNDLVDPATRSGEVHIVLENVDHKIKPGLFVLAEIRPRSRQAIILERRAIRTTDGKAHVFIEREGQAIRRTVTYTDLDAEHVEIKSGLAAGEAVLAGANLTRIDHRTPVLVRSSDQSLRIGYELIRK
jgi:RND family efflux transporter MFP subunit